MEYTNQLELYLKLIPAFNVKKRLINYTRHKHITNENIWHYLVETKWKISYNLTISDIVNDIITVDVDLINKYMGGK